MQRLLFVLVVVGASLGLFGSSLAHAGSFDIVPISITLSPAASTGMLVLTNKGAELVRFHVTAFAWDQAADGEMVVKPTNDIVFFPAMVSLNPGEARKIRVGVNVKPGTVERSYRVFVQELPKLVKVNADSASAVHMLTKMGIPVFFEAATRKAVPAVSGLAINGKRVSFSATNRGTAHYRAEKIVVSAKDASTVVHSEEVKGWYVLAGGTRAYVVELPQAACATLKSLQVDLHSDRGDAKAVLANARCGP